MGTGTATAARRRIRPGFRIDLRLTLGGLRHGRHDPTMRIGPDGVWRASRTPDGAATLHIRSWGEEIEVLAWGPGAAFALDRADALVGACDDQGFETRHPKVRDLHRRLGSMRIPRTGSVLETLLPTIIGQKVIASEASRSYAKLVWNLSERAPGPRAGLWVPPDPLVVAGTPGWRFHPWDIELKRADTVRRAALVAPRLEEAAALTPAEASTRLRSVDGIGPWTAASVVRAALGDPDAVIVGDYHLPHVVSWALAREPRATDDRMLELLEPFAGHRGRVQRLLAVGSGHAPRYGPRLPIRRIADH